MLTQSPNVITLTNDRFFTTAYDTTYGDITLTDVYDSIDAVITKLELMKLHGTFEECETLTIKCREVTDNKVLSPDIIE